MWGVFSVGGTIAALLFPVHMFLSGLAFPLGWLDAPSFEALRALVQHPVVRLYLFVLISFPLFHWAHRFRYTLYDVLQLYHLTVLIAVLCYGAALVGTAVAAYTLWNLA
jgi:fumarate reductase subunit D